MVNGSNLFIWGNSMQMEFTSDNLIVIKVAWWHFIVSLTGCVICTFSAMCMQNSASINCWVPCSHSAVLVLTVSNRWSRLFCFLSKIKSFLFCFFLNLVFFLPLTNSSDKKIFGRQVHFKIDLLCRQVIFLFLFLILSLHSLLNPRPWRISVR